MKDNRCIMKNVGSNVFVAQSILVTKSQVILAIFTLPKLL